VDDARAVSGPEGLGDLPDERQGGLDLEAPARDEVGEALPVHLLHHEE